MYFAGNNQLKYCDKCARVHVLRTGLATAEYAVCGLNNYTTLKYIFYENQGQVDFCT